MNRSISILARIMALAAVSVCLAFAPTARAVTPAPDGGYSGGNTAEGDQALNSLIGGVWNTANGFEALFSDTNGSANTATGFSALSSNIAGSNNAAYGDYALFNSTGGGNIAVGHFAGVNLTTGSNNIDIGNRGTDGESNTIRIGTTGTHAHAYMVGISNNVVDGDPVVVDAGGQLGIPPAPSSARFTEDIHPMDRESEAILSLQPVTFRYKKEIDSKGAPRFGLIAEEVEKVNPALVTRGPDHQLHTVRYEAINAMLLNEFLKEHRTVEQLKSTVAKQEAIIAQQAKQMETFMAGLKEQGAQLQKVSAQLAVSKPAPQVVNNR